MQEPLSVETAIEKALESSENAFLMALEISIRNPDTWIFEETMRFVRNSENYTYQGKVFEKANFSLDVKHDSGELPSVSLGVTDIDRVLQKRMQAYSGGVGSLVKIIIINTGNPNQPSELEADYFVLSASASGVEINWSLGIENPGLIRAPRRTQTKDRCEWRFKSIECGYEGSDISCDLSLQGPNGCSSRNNEGNFGAYPGLSNRG